MELLRCHTLLLPRTDEPEKAKDPKPGAATPQFMSVRVVTRQEENHPAGGDSPPSCRGALIIIYDGKESSTYKPTASSSAKCGGIN